MNRLSISIDHQTSTSLFTFTSNVDFLTLPTNAVSQVTRSIYALESRSKQSPDNRRQNLSSCTTGMQIRENGLTHNSRDDKSRTVGNVKRCKWRKYFSFISVFFVKLSSRVLNYMQTYVILLHKQIKKCLPF